MRKGPLEILQLLLRTQSEHLEDSHSETSTLAITECCEHAIVLSRLIDIEAHRQGYWSEADALCIAARIGNEDALTRLLDEGANANSAIQNPSKHFPPLQYANSKIRPYSQHLTALQFAAEHNNIGAVHILLCYGASVDEHSLAPKSWTPLCLATSKGHEEIARVLLEARANPNKMTGLEGVLGRTTPLVQACSIGNSQIVDCLLAAGAAVDMHDKVDMTPLCYAAKGK